MMKLESTRSGNVFNGWVLALGALGTSLINLLVVTPWTSKLMFKRHRLEKQEGKSYTDPTVCITDTFQKEPGERTDVALRIFRPQASLKP